MQTLTLVIPRPGAYKMRDEGERSTSLSRGQHRAPSAILVTILLHAAMLVGPSPGLAQVVPETMNGVPLLPIPTYEEVGLPTFTMPTGTASPFPPPPSNGGTPSDGGGGVGGSGPALNTMLSRSWGEAAASNATAMGVNPTALAATCVMESGCRVPPPGAYPNIVGAFQMLNSTYTAAINAAVRENPSLVPNIDRSLAGSMDPANQSIAAAQELKNVVARLQAGGIQNPTVLDARPGFQFGPKFAVDVAKAPDSQPLGSLLTTWEASTYTNNRLTPQTTVGEWRARVMREVGTAAREPVLLPAAGVG